MDTIVIGIDGGEWDVIDPLIEDGALPNLSSLIDSGVRGELESISPPVSPPAWTSIQTGSNPGKHGIYDFSTFDEKYGRRSINSSDREATPFWNVMNDYGVETGLFKVPFTYPPSDIDGFLVTGFPTPDVVDDYAKPDRLSDEIGAPERLFEDWGLQRQADYEEFKNNLIEVAERQTNILSKLLSEFDTELLMTVYDGSDRIQHFFWKYFDDNHPRFEDDSNLSTAFHDYYQVVDDGIGDLLGQAGPDTNVLIISDHGFGELSYDIYIDEWLEQQGFLSRNSATSPNEIARGTSAMVIKEGWKAVKRIGLNEAVHSMLPDSLFEKGRELQDESKRATQWNETTAFFGTLSGQAIFVNLERRFQEGTVSGEEYEETIDALQKSLFELTHPQTGDSLVEDVIRTDERFEGWAIEKAPDLIVETAPEYTLKGGRSETLIAPSKQNQNDRSGDHRSNGIFIASGPAFETGTIEGASVLDIAPTLLYLHRCPIPNAMDGSVLTEMFTTDAKKEREIKQTEKYGQTFRQNREWSPEEESELEEQLSSMGYLD